MIITKKEQIFLPAKKFGVSQMCEYRVIKHEKGGKYILKATSYYVEPNSISRKRQFVDHQSLIIRLRNPSILSPSAMAIALPCSNSAMPRAILV